MKSDSALAVAGDGNDGLGSGKVKSAVGDVASESQLFSKRVEAT